MQPKPPGDKGKGEEDDDDEDSLDWWSRYYETVKDGEREQEEEVAKEAQKDVAVSKKDKKGDKDQDPPKRKKKPNPKITRIKVNYGFIFKALPPEEFQLTFKFLLAGLYNRLLLRFLISNTRTCLNIFLTTS